ncbi:efflux RND transporter periplasmic adaptor subunit [Histidinibacterium aquaticum]|uniref:Efflux RND transporter periplasmic adaptor subunit n=1 Tax=Histidinibacterium aquaticum TaxID=2613962 RepID=A0A5J5GLS1_9RHOB|nr:efflux RND transporter periplasmic adaptor subunit [Histidinibacterium aquaticum]KAA9009241.1 efflux RND transporter periplasmic adaptor subunit [Histidinibacterium aquaticum]
MATKDEVETVLGRAGRGRRRKRGVYVLAALLIVGAVVWAVVSFTNRSGPEWIAEPVARTDIVATVTATGYVQPTNQVEISSELSGVVDEVLVDDADTVEEGEVLMRLDRRRFAAAVKQGQAQIAAAEAAVDEARAILDEAELALSRTTTLLDRGTASIEQHVSASTQRDRAAASLASAEARLSLAEAELDIAETDLERTCICSPIDGVVLERSVEPGQIVAASLQSPVLFTIAEDLSRMELDIDVDESDIGRVEVGQSATFVVDAFDDREFPARISELGYMPRTIDGIVTYRAVLAIDNEDRLLRPGMTATARIVTSEVGDALAVPNAALRFTPPVDVIPEPTEITGRRVWVVDGETIRPVPLRTGLSDGEVTEVLEGDLSEEDSVVVDMGAR